MHTRSVLIIPAVSERPTLDIPEAAELLGLDRLGGYRAAKGGYLPTVQVSERRWKVPTAALRTLLGLPVDGPAVEVPHQTRASGVA